MPRNMQGNKSLGGQSETRRSPGAAKRPQMRQTKLLRKSRVGCWIETACIAGTTRGRELSRLEGAAVCLDMSHAPYCVSVPNAKWAQAPHKECPLPTNRLVDHQEYCIDSAVILRILHLLELPGRVPVPPFKMSALSGKCRGGHNPSHFRSNLHSHSLLLQEVLFKNETNKACCCDELCESVETATNLFAACTWRAESQVAFCENGGKLGSLGAAHEADHTFIRFREKVLRSFLNSSPQDLLAIRAAF